MTEYEEMMQWIDDLRLAALDVICGAVAVVALLCAISPIFFA